MSKDDEQAACNGEGDRNEDPVDTMDEEDASKAQLTSDPNKVKFTSVSLEGYDGKNGDAKVDIYIAQTTVGMGKEELMKYANEPFWVRLRLFLFIFFWLAWIAMLVGAIVIILLAPRCPPAPKLDWYQKSPMYEVDVETFKDSDGNGIGDLKGLISKLNYFKENNVGTLILNSFYKSMGKDAITDHKQVDERLGTLADFEELVNEMEEKDIKLVIDFVPNHSSDQHKWFLASASKTEPYSDYYVWQKDNNNWINITGGGAWAWSDVRGEYYFQTLGWGKPEFNLRNEQVRREMKDILRFWLERGVHGFRIKAASHLIEDPDNRDEPLSTEQSVPMPKYEEVDHKFTLNWYENFALLAEWRELLDQFLGTNGTTLRRILLAEVSGPPNVTAEYYGNDTFTLVDLPINSRMTDTTVMSTGLELKESIETWTRFLPKDAWPTLLVGSGSSSRLASRVGKDLVDAMYMVATIAKGTPITYYGDELGMTDFKDSEGMIHQSVMLWNNETSAGFSSRDTLNVHPDYMTVNVEIQKQDKQSHLNIFKRLLALRAQPALGFGLQEYPIVTNETFSMIRVRKGSPGYLTVINLSSNSTVIDFTGTSKYLPEMGRVEIRSSNLLEGPFTEGDHPKIYLNHIPLEAKQAVIFSFVPQFKE